ncbi:MAG TPA: response regulator transcription factor [Chthoniobacterales bacterium]|nr:response regulator transcription factor [Chthoniobacterales bacterium]
MKEQAKVAAPAEVAKKRILLVDDHPIFRHGLEDLLKKQDDLVICGHAGSAPAALEEMRNLHPDLAIVDISINGANGIELVKQMKAEMPHLAILVLSMHDESLYALRALKAGALGYVMKAEALQHVIEAVRRVLGGRIFVSPRFGEQLIFKAVHGSETGAPSPVDRLSDRELEVLMLLGKGHNTKSIAKELNLSVKTIETHRAHIKEKLGFSDASEMVRFAIDWVTHQEMA